MENGKVLLDINYFIRLAPDYRGPFKTRTWSQMTSLVQGPKNWVINKVLSISKTSNFPKVVIQLMRDTLGGMATKVSFEQCNISFWTVLALKTVVFWKKKKSNVTPKGGGGVRARVTKCHMGKTGQKTGLNSVINYLNCLKKFNLTVRGRKKWRH